MNNKQKKIILKTVSYLFLGLAVLLLVYIFIFPFFPEIKYRVENKENTQEKIAFHSFPESATLEEKKEIAKQVKAETEKELVALPAKEFQYSKNRLVISKIGVNVPIIESANEEYGLSLGAWHVPESSTPDQGGNTVITGHRFKYLPPSNLTFYLFHKLQKNDIVSVLWKGEYYFYQIREVKIVEPSALEIMDPTDESILTMFTCHPIYSQKQRLVVVAELMS